LPGYKKCIVTRGICRTKKLTTEKKLGGRKTLLKQVGFLFGLFLRSKEGNKRPSSRPKKGIPKLRQKKKILEHGTKSRVDQKTSFTELQSLEGEVQMRPRDE